MASFKKVQEMLCLGVIEEIIDEEEFVPLYAACRTLKSLNRQNGFRTTLERHSCHKDFKITQAQTKVSFFYLIPLLQVEFRALFEPFSYIL